jgi:hypothetical protein
VEFTVYGTAHAIDVKVKLARKRLTKDNLLIE